MWPTLRDFLQVPVELTGKGVRIAVVDGRFSNHPDISTNRHRTTHIVHVMDSEPHPEVFYSEPEPWAAGSSHALRVAAGAAGSGAASQGLYTGVAPEADLFLIGMYFPEHKSNPDKYLPDMKALEWVRDNWRKYEIRAVMAARSFRTDSGILPWQMEPVRILCEELAEKGVLVISGSGNVPDQTASVAQTASPSVLSVGGIIIPPSGDPSRAEMYQGCRGTTFEGKWVPQILAPAANIALPDVEIAQLLYAKIDSLPDGYARTNGTSFAGPILLGAAACLWQAHPNWTASEMKAALIASSKKEPQWSELRAGLVSVRDALAIKETESTPEPSIAPFQNWSSWRNRPLQHRLAKLNSTDHEEVKDAILSFLGDAIPPQAIEPISKHVKHSIAEVRTAALCALATEPDQINANHIQDAFRDASPNVRMAGVYSLQKCQNLWLDCKTSFSNLFNDTSLDVRYQSLLLAARMAYPDFTAEIAAGLEEDAQMGRVANFTARRDALEAITGQQFPLNSPPEPGKIPHSNSLRDARMDLARRWKDWLSSDWSPTLARRC